MLKIRKIVTELSEANYKGLCEKFKKNSGNKFLRLLELYRRSDYTDEDIRRHLKMEAPAFYTLRSRLMDRIQDHLLASPSYQDVDQFAFYCFSNEALFNSGKEYGTAMLEKLLINYEKSGCMIGALSVLSVLKQLNANNQRSLLFARKYSECYEKLMLQERTNELSTRFSQTLTKYLLSADDKFLRDLDICYRELDQLVQRLNFASAEILRELIRLQMILFVPQYRAVLSQEFEIIIKRCRALFSEMPEVHPYRNYEMVLPFFQFEFYSQNENIDFQFSLINEVGENLERFLKLNYITCPLFFIGSVNAFLRYHGLEPLRLDSHEEIVSMLDESDMATGYYANYYQGTTYYFERNYKEASRILNTAVSELSTIEFPMCDIEVRLALVLCSVKQKDYKLAIELLEKLRRKQQSLVSDNFGFLPHLINLIQINIKDSHGGRIHRNAADEWLLLKAKLGHGNIWLRSIWFELMEFLNPVLA